MLILILPSHGGCKAKSTYALQLGSKYHDQGCITVVVTINTNVRGEIQSYRTSHDAAKHVTARQRQTLLGPPESLANQPRPLHILSKEGGFAATDMCPSGKCQTISHIVNSCPQFTMEWAEAIADVATEWLKTRG